MAFIIEDGTGKEDSNSYLTVQEFKDYFEDRLTTTFAEPDNIIQVWLVNATEYVDQNYNFYGQKKDTATPQALEFPRSCLVDDKGTSYDSDIVPVVLKNGVSELALIYSQNSSLEYNVIVDTIKSKSLGPGSKTFKTGLEIGGINTPVYSKANKALSRLIEDTQIRIVRV